MHSEWAANMEQTTSMTHETALQITEDHSQKMCTDWHNDGNPEGWCGQKSQHNSNTSQWDINTNYSLKKNKYMGINVSCLCRTACEDTQNIRTTTRWAHKDVCCKCMNAGWWSSVKEEYWSMVKVDGWRICWVGGQGKLQSIYTASEE